MPMLIESLLRRFRYAIRRKKSNETKQWIERFESRVLLSSSQYQVDQVTIEGNLEYHLLASTFHFASVVVGPNGQPPVLRFHPDKTDANGWGPSVLLPSYLAGGNATGATISEVVATATGIDIAANGPITYGGPSNFGTWQLTIHLAYDPLQQHVTGSGVVAMQLAAPLTADLNILPIRTNYLLNVPLQGGGTGITGDTKQLNITYSPTGDPRDFMWVPTLAQPANYPQNYSAFLGIEALGTVNKVDTSAKGFQIAVAHKPTVVTCPHSLYQML